LAGPGILLGKEQHIMADDLKTRGPGDLTRVNIDEMSDVAYWCEEWGCTENELKAAVMLVGDGAGDVMAQLTTAGQRRRAPLSLDSDR
jgi:hypothetical protein